MSKISMLLMSILMKSVVIDLSSIKSVPTRISAMLTSIQGQTADEENPADAR